MATSTSIFNSPASNSSASVNPNASVQKNPQFLNFGELVKNITNPHTGSWGSKDYGITEFFKPVINVTKPAQAAAPAGGAPAGGTPTTKTTTQTKSSGGTPTQTSVPQDQYVPSGGIDERALIDEQQNRVRAGINDAYSPIFAQLDSMIGAVPGQRQEFETGIGTQADLQKESVALQKGQNIAQLDNAAQKEFSMSKDSMRNLENDIRNSLQSYSQYFGAKGAADSSAPLVASEAIARGGLQARGKVLAARDSALNAIELKKTDVNTISDQENNKIDQWKGNKLLEIQQWAADRIGELENAKLSASGSRAQAIAQLITNTEGEYVNRLRQLDDNVTQYKSAIATWQQQRAADLEDYGKKLQIAAQYSSDNPNVFGKVLNDFTKIYGTGAINLGQARDAITDAYGVDPLSGVELTPEQLNKVKEDPFAALERNLAGSLGS